MPLRFRKQSWYNIMEGIRMKSCLLRGIQRQLQFGTSCNMMVIMRKKLSSILETQESRIFSV
eukprot:scaffold5528_cov46-Cyclotella_meneghiniana.AAC.2